GDIAILRSALERDPELARKAQLTVAASGAASLEALDLLERHGADWNASWRGYRPLHALIQERSQGERAAPSKGRLESLEFLLAHGADPERLGAFPAASALIVAAMTGVAEFVAKLLEHGAKRDGFAASALGDLARVKRALAA